MADTRRLPPTQTSAWDWQLKAACRLLDSEFFFHPEGERGPARHQRENRAKAVCQSCPVLRQCRKHALAVREPYGIWGGMSRRDRDLITGPTGSPATEQLVSAAT